MNQQELHQALEATCLFGDNIKIGTNYIHCGRFRFELEPLDGNWRVFVGGSGSFVPNTNIVEPLLLDLFANELVWNWFPNAQIVLYNQKWSLGDDIYIENEDGVWTMTIDGEVIENGVLYQCVTRLLGICEAIV